MQVHTYSYIHVHICTYVYVRAYVCIDTYVLNKSHNPYHIIIYIRRSQYACGYPYCIMCISLLLLSQGRSNRYNKYDMSLTTFLLAKSRSHYTNGYPFCIPHQPNSFQFLKCEFDCPLHAVVQPRAGQAGPRPSQMPAVLCHLDCKRSRYSNRTVK